MRSRTMLLVVSLVGALALVSVAFASKPPPKPKHGKGQGHHHMYAWHDVATGTTAHFRGLAALSANKAWVSGYTATGGVVFRTLDRGATWQDVSPAGTPPTLQFRDIEAFDANHAVVMSSGTGPDSQIYRTADGGQTWTLVFQNTEPNAFYDCMTFFNRKVGLAVSDPPDALKFRVIKTTDGGQTWNVVDPAGMPPALPGEFAFAASGQCLTSNHGRSAWFGSGGSAQARVFTSRNRGRTWTVSPTPLNSGPSAGINALAFRSQQHGLAVGGDFAQRRPNLGPAHGRPGRVPLRRDVGQWQHGTRRGTVRQRLQQERRPHLDALRRRQPRHRRLREPERLLGLGR
jgi:photosystem II stability/assembly factor-like uncharacterized protein